MFKPNSLYYVDCYKIGHKAMLAPGTTRLYGTEIPRSLKYGPKGATKIVNFGKQIVWRWINDQFTENFFNRPIEDVQEFIDDMSLMLGQPLNGEHFKELHKLGYLPIHVLALPEGAQTKPNIPHSVFINTVDGFAWLTLFLETIASSLTWKPSLAATIALQYRKQAEYWVNKTDKDNIGLVDYMCHDFSARGLNPHDMVSVGLGHATSFRGSDTLITIPAVRYYYNEPKGEAVINSVNASEHSVSTTKIFTVGEQQMLEDWMKIFPEGILSVVADTFDLWTLITKYLPTLKEQILGRNGKLVIRPDSGDPVDIICGESHIVIKSTNQVDMEIELSEYLESHKSNYKDSGSIYVFNGITYFDVDYSFIDDTDEVEIDLWAESDKNVNSFKGVIELLWNIFGGTINSQGYKVLDPHIGAIYGDSITLERQEEIYKRLEAKGFAATNIVLGVGSYTYQYNTRDSIGLAYKGAWFEVKDCACSQRGLKVEGSCSDRNRCTKSYDIYKDPITDDGTKKSLKGFQFVYKDEEGEYQVESQVSEEKGFSEENELKTIFRDGEFFNQVTLTEIRERLKD